MHYLLNHRCVHFVIVESPACALAFSACAAFASRTVTFSSRLLACFPLFLGDLPFFHVERPCNTQRHPTFGEFVLLVVLVKLHTIFTRQRFPRHRVLKVESGDEVVTKDLPIKKVFHFLPFAVIAAKLEWRIPKLRKRLERDRIIFGETVRMTHEKKGENRWTQDRESRLTYATSHPFA
jgi:hypothetical protein